MTDLAIPPPPVTLTCPEQGALLAEVRGSVLGLLAELPRLPERLRVSVGDVAVELEWPASLAPDAPSETVTAAEPGLSPAQAPDQWLPPPGTEQVLAPTVGTFYRSPEPGAQPFVEVGDSVRPGQQVAILEAMKLMLPVEVETDGVVIEILKRDAAAVEYGEPLFLLEPVGRG